MKGREGHDDVRRTGLRVSNVDLDAVSLERRPSWRGLVVEALTGDVVAVRERRSAEVIKPEAGGPTPCPRQRLI